MMNSLGRVASLLLHIALGTIAVGFIVGLLGWESNEPRTGWALLVGTILFAIPGVRRFRSGEPMWGEDD